VRRAGRRGGFLSPKVQSMTVSLKQRTFTNRANWTLSGHGHRGDRYTIIRPCECASESAETSAIPLGSIQYGESTLGDLAREGERHLRNDDKALGEFQLGDAASGEKPMSSSSVTSENARAQSVTKQQARSPSAGSGIGMIADCITFGMRIQQIFDLARTPCTWGLRFPQSASGGVLAIAVGCPIGGATLALEECLPTGELGSR